MKTCHSARRFLTALAALACLCIAASAAHAQTVINSLPYTINSSGLYVLNSSLNSTQTSGNLILINASNVTLDFQDHYIAGPVGNSTQTTYGVYANEQSNITIKNGTVAYCDEGIYLNGNGNATTNAVGERIENMRVTYCYSVGIDMVNLPSSRVVNCQVSQIGSSTAPSPIGINIIGSGITALSNAVSNITAAPSGTSYCIYADSGSFLRSNQVSTATYGIELGIYQDNLAHACTNAFDGGTDGGGNAHD